MSAGGPSLPGQTVVVIGGSAGIGLETARLARAEGAEVVLTARDAGRLQGAADEIGARGATPFDAADPDALAAFFDGLAGPVDHVMVTAGRPYYAPLAEFDVEAAQRSSDEHLWLAVRVARLRVPAALPEVRRYTGCVSWVELDEDVRVARALPALPDDAFARRLDQLTAALGAPRPGGRRRALVVAARGRRRVRGDRRPRRAAVRHDRRAARRRRRRARLDRRRLRLPARLTG